MHTVTDWKIYLLKDQSGSREDDDGGGGGTVGQPDGALASVADNAWNSE